MAADRLEMLLAQTRVTGIDYVFVHASQTTLDVFFLVEPSALSPAWSAPVPVQDVVIRSISARATTPFVTVASTAWVTVGGRSALRIEATTPGDFSRYELHLDGAPLDRRYNDVVFSFKANCPSDLDCELPAPECPPEASPDYAVDYSARDFWSYRRALLDFATQRYPEYKDRLEADAGIMLAEVMAALGDEMAYYQDRVAREATLGSATERRSVRSLARLVDYEIDDGSAAFTWLDVTVAPGAVVQLAAGTKVWADPELGGERVWFEVGHRLDEALASPPVSYGVRGDWNELSPHIWDEDETCLAYGATELWVVGHQRASLFPIGGASERWLLLRTTPDDPSRPARVHLVRVRADDVVEDRDEVFGVDVTRLAWDARYATPFALDLEVLVVRANLVPATAGKTSSALFSIGYATASEGAPAAIEREGPGRVTIYRHSLAGSDASGLCWVSSNDGRLPEVRLFEQVDLGGGSFARGTEWRWRRSLLGVASSDPEDRHFTLEDGSWGNVLHWDRPSETLYHRDYKSGSGFTLRFGDGEFGRLPLVGTRFEVAWRLGNGARGNVAANTLVGTELLDPASSLFQAEVLAVTNPLTASGGRDPETLEQVRERAPQAFRTLTYRAVRPEDYAEAVERLDDVQRAGAELRWTGSWLTLFATPDPRGTIALSEALENTVQDQLDRFRQAGRPAHVRKPVFAFIDLEITLCVEPSAYCAEVKERVLVALFGSGHAWSARGFFHPDHFTFGSRLERSQLEATLHAVPGVRAVKSMKIRRRGHFPLRDFTEPYYAPAPNEVIGLQNDNLYPERGSLRLLTEGGA